jgi:photosystem II stability/assembly factor-like uncharacterized protein
MRLKNLSLSILLLLLLTNCSVTSEDKDGLSITGEFGSRALQDQQVYTLETHGNHLFAGTSQGMVFFNISSGLERSGAFMQKSAVPTFAISADDNWLISADFGADSASSGIYRSTDRGSSWRRYDNGFGGNRQLIPYTMDVSDENPSVIFARSAALSVVAKSSDAGQSWQSVIQSWENPNLGTSSFVKINPHHPENVWAGGATAIFRPSLLKSEDHGENWTGFLVIKDVETTVHDIASHPSQPRTVLAGMAGAIEPANIIRKSTDGGETWETVLEGINTRTLTHSAADPAVVYASGRNAAGSLFFVASGDFGESWDTVEWEDSPAGVQINDMVSVIEDGREVLYFGTNKGIFSYTFNE